MPFHNDEWTLDDRFEGAHNKLVCGVAKLIDECEPPYVIGISGSWGSGKTSILRKLWVAFGGEHASDEKGQTEQIRSDCGIKTEDYEAIWFSPWKHQFESSPVVALLHEIRVHFTLKKRFTGKARKYFDVILRSSMDIMSELVRSAALSSGEIQRKGERYEEENFETLLVSQRFEQCFAEAIEDLLGEKRQGSDKEKRLVVFIDDLDRCREKTALRLLESLKLYLGAPRCVFVLGMDRRVIESAIEHEGYSPREAREYLDKVFQITVPVPTPSVLEPYVKKLLEDYEKVWPKAYEFAREHFNDCLPHNPRKIKTFLNAWMFCLGMLERRMGKDAVNLGLSVVLTFLSVFDETLYRRIEARPILYRDLHEFVHTGNDPGPRFGGISFHEDIKGSHTAGGLGGEAFEPDLDFTETEIIKTDKGTEERDLFFIARLIRKLDLPEDNDRLRELISLHLINCPEAECRRILEERKKAEEEGRADHGSEATTA